MAKITLQKPLRSGGSLIGNFNEELKAGTQEPQTIGQMVKESNVYRALEEMDKQLTRLESLMASLITRLEPVTIDRNHEGGDTDPEPCPPTSVMARRIDGFTDRIDRTANAVNGLLQDLDV